MNPEDSATTTALTPMYASNHTYQTFIDWLSEMSVVPSQIDRSLWGTKFSGSSGAQLMAGLRFLKLLDGERPTDLLRELVATPKAERKPLLERVLRGAYGDALLDDLPSMTPGLLDRKLRDLGTTDATHRKAVSFFINAVKETDVAVPGVIAKRARNRPSTPAKKRRSNGATPVGGATPKGDDDGDDEQEQPADDFRARYIAVLLERVEQSEELDQALLDRIERILGFANGDDA